MDANNTVVKKVSCLSDSVVGVEDDFGVHTSIAEALENKVIDTDVSENALTIGLFGEWGSGKSLIVEKLYDKLKNKSNIAIINIDVWRYNGIPLLRHILYEIVRKGTAQKFTNDEKDRLLAKIKYDISVGTELTPYKSKFAKFLEHSIGTIKNISLAISLISIAYSFLVGVDKWSLIGVGLIPNIALLSFAYEHCSGFAKNIMKWVGEVSESIVVLDKTVVPTISPEQFEEVFEELHKELNKKGITKTVIVFDNIDRCKGEFAYEVLSTIKTYMSKPNCIYIIPCDDVAIKHYLSNQYNGNINSSFNRDFSSEFLDKLFNTCFRIPLTNELSRDKFIKKCISKTVLEKLADDSKIAQVLYYAYKGETPRQIKKYINDLISYYEIAQKVDDNEEFLLDDIEVFSVMISIKQIAPNFERRLVENPDLIWDIKDLDTKSLSGEEKKVQDFLNKLQFNFPENKSVRSYVFFEKVSPEAALFDTIRSGEYFELSEENTVLARKILDVDATKSRFLQNDFNSIVLSIITYGVDDFYAKQKTVKVFNSLSNALNKVVNESIDYDIVVKFFKAISMRDTNDYHSILKLLGVFMVDEEYKIEFLKKVSSLKNSKDIYGACLCHAEDAFGNAISGYIKDCLEEQQELSEQFIALIESINESGKYQYLTNEVVEKVSPMIHFNSDERLRKWELDIVQKYDVGLQVPKIKELSKHCKDIISGIGVTSSSNPNNFHDKLDYLFSFALCSLEALQRNASELLQSDDVREYFEKYFIKLSRYPDRAMRAFVLASKLFGKSFVENNYNANLPFYNNRAEFIDIICSDSRNLDVFMETDRVRGLLLHESQVLDVILENTSREWKLDNVDKFFSRPVDVEIIKRFLNSDEWTNRERNYIYDEMYKQTLYVISDFVDNKNVNEQELLTLVEYVFEKFNADGKLININADSDFFNKLIVRKVGVAAKVIVVLDKNRVNIVKCIEKMLEGLIARNDISDIEFHNVTNIASIISKNNINSLLVNDFVVRSLSAANSKSMITLGLEILENTKKINESDKATVIKNLGLIKGKGIFVERITDVLDLLNG